VRADGIPDVDSGGVALAIVELALSSLVCSAEQVLPMLVVTIMVSMVLAGGLITVTARSCWSRFHGLWQTVGFRRRSVECRSE
jgi:hypothetical protein